MPFPAMPGTAGVTTTRRARSRTRTCGRRTAGGARGIPEYELLDTGVFDDDRYWIVEVHYAKADPHDLLMSIQVTNAGPEAETLHVLPTAWFRNTWSWEFNAPRPELAATGPAAVSVDHPFLGELELLGGPGPDGAEPTLLFCENETNHGRLYGVASSPAYPKDGINDHVVAGAATVNPGRSGHEVRVVVPTDGGSGGDGRAAPAHAPPGRQPQTGSGAWATTSTR